MEERGGDMNYDLIKGIAFIGLPIWVLILGLLLFGSGRYDETGDLIGVDPGLLSMIYEWLVKRRKQ